MIIIEKLGRHARRPAIVVGSFILAGVLVACGDTETPEAAPPPETDGGGGHESATPPASDARHIEVGARSFAFDPDEITVKSGEEIAIVLTSEDSLHDFTVDEFDGHVSADASETTIGAFRADEPGRYSFYCTVPGHREGGMEGVLVVEA